MTEEKDEDQEVAVIAARLEEIRSGLDAAYTQAELQQPMSMRRVHALIAAAIAATAVKLKALSARVEALEENGIKYMGNYQRACPYVRGDAVTHSGSLWVALKAVAAGAAPGSDPTCWQLASKGDKPVIRASARSTS